MGTRAKNAQFAVTCRKRAAELRDQAEAAATPVLRESLLKLAQDWIKLAEDAEREADNTRHGG